MSYFDPDTTILINNMWERVKGETFHIGLIIGATILVVLIAVAIVLYRHKDSLKIKMPEFRRKTLADKGYKVVKKEDL
jgi:NADH:ubiquinone oxidoreductase subunit K